MQFHSTLTPPQAAKSKSNFVPVPRGLLQRKCACGGECEDCKAKRVQRKLNIGSSDDPMELEADRAADQAMSKSLQTTLGKAPPRIQRFSSSPVGPVEAAPPSVEGVLSNQGRPLDRVLRKDMEQRFGHDFSRVRVHTDSAAEQSARAVNAHAYTVGQDIVFGAGQYSPNSHVGKRLLSHELAHVVQQSEWSTTPRLQRKECKADRKCCSPDACAQPDAAEKSSGAESDWWTLTVNVDIEADDWDEALRKQKFGHTFVRFAESDGTQYTYGFYPAGEVPTENKRSVDGCVNHPDTSHDACTDRAETFFLKKKEQYQAALKLAQDACRTHHFYGVDSGVSYTCTTYAADVTKAAGKSMPSSASKPTTVYYQPVPSIHNPNTLNENLASQSRGLGTEDEVLATVEIWGEAMLKRMNHQEKSRWIRILLDGWISDRDIDAVVKIATNTSASDLASIRSAVDSSVKAMNTSKQQQRVRSALGY